MRFVRVGHISLAIDHICLRGVAWQFTSICSIDSVTLHIVQSSRCSLFGMFLQNRPIFWVLCIALYRNCLTRVRKVRRRILPHIVSSVSNRLLYSWIASLVAWRFLSVVAQ